MLFVAAVAGVLLMVLACHRSAAEPGGPPIGRPYGLQKRLPWTTSRIVGSPDPLWPFRVERAFPNLKLNYPIAVAHQPGSDRLLLITAAQSYGPVPPHLLAQSRYVARGYHCLRLAARAT